MASRFPLVPKAQDQKTPMNTVDKLSLIPKTLDQKAPGSLAERLALVPKTSDHKAPGDADEKYPYVPKTLDHKAPADMEEKHSLVPRTLDHKSPMDLAERFGLGRTLLHKRERPMFAISDDRVMLDRVRKTHSPDMLTFEAKSLLSVVEDIFNSPVPTIDGLASKTAPVFKDYTDHGLFEAFADLIEQISCEIECKCIHGGESHGLASVGLHQDSKNTTTFSVLHMVSKYQWDSKLVLILSALAVKYGVFLLLAQTYTNNQLTKSLAMIKQLPSILSHPTALIQRLEKTRLLMQDMVDITNTIIKICGLPPQYSSEASFGDHTPMAVYWTVRSVLVCMSQISSITGFEHEKIMSFMEVSEIQENSERLRKMNAYLTGQLEKFLKEMEKRNIVEEIRGVLVPMFTTTIHVDVVTPLLRLFRPIDFLYHGPGSAKKRVGMDPLRQKHVLLLISDLENLQEELYILEHIYNDAWQQSFEIVWVPVQDPYVPWTDLEKTKYETLYSNMRWYVLPEPWRLGKAAIRFIKEYWNFKTKPILVALDDKGKVASTNTFPMVWIWQSLAYPFTSSRERDLWVEQEQAWNLELLVDGTDPSTLNWIVEGSYICLYGGEDIEWIRKFTTTWKSVAKAANIPLQMVYVGKRNPKEKIQRVMDTIRAEKLSHTLPDLFYVWFFWIRIESMWESRQQSIRTRSVTVEKEPVLNEITTLLSYGGNAEGWGLVSRSSEEIVRAGGDVFVLSLTEFEEWRVHITEKGFLPALKDHLLKRHPAHHCTRFILPAAAGIIPEKMVCSECDRTMEKYFLYQCCLE